MGKIKKNVSTVKRLKPARKTKKVIKPTKVKKQDYSSMSVENFFEKDFNESESEYVEDENNQATHQDSSEDAEEVRGSDSSEDAEEVRGSDTDEDNENESGDEIEAHKNALARLQKTDPEFYNFLQENDTKLLKFNLSDEEPSDIEEDTEVQFHKPPQELEVASDESDFEPDDDTDKIKDHGVITLKMLKNWEINIQQDNSNRTITTLTQAFHACLHTVSPDGDEESSQFIVEGSAVFNAVIQLCVIQLGPALRRFLGLKSGSRQPPHKCKKFVKVKRILKGYFADLTKLLQNVSSANIQTVLLKHLHYISPFLASYPNISKSILKCLISIWGTGEEGVRVLTFFCILRITNGQRATFLNTVLKSMYITFVRNSKFVSVNSLASVNFMRRSLVEMYALDVNTSYQHVFLYIRQLAIHLRNAITVHKKENIQSVYNWQYINSLKLWGNLLSVTSHKPQLQQLIYPFVQVCLGVIKLIPTAQYYPLRFHVVQTLMDLSRDTGVFIPILPFLLEVLIAYDFNKKHQKVSMKPLQFTCMLRASKSQMTENGFKDAIIENIYGQLLEYLVSQSHSISFPDLSIICIVQIKQFLKKCSNANYKRKIKQILDKIEQNNLFIENERSKLTINITDFKQMAGLESQIKTKGTPISIFYDSWKKVHTLKKNKQLTNNEELGDYKLPSIKKRARKEREVGPVELFPSDSEDSSNDLEVEKKKKRGKRGGKNNAIKKVKDESGPVEDDGGEDLVEDLKINEW